MNPITTVLSLCAGGLVIFAGALALRLDAQEAKTDKARTETLAANALAAQERAAREATEAELGKANAIATATTKALNEAHQATQAATADAVRARRAGDSLRQYGADLAASAGAASQDPAPASPGPSAGQAAAMLADMLGRCSEAHGELAEFADRAHAAGIACERISDAVTP